MAVENTPPCSDFLVIMADLESANPVANVAAMNQASALIAGGKLPEPLLLCRRLIPGLASNLKKPQHENVVKEGFYSTLMAIKAAIMSNQMNMDSSACGEALQAIQYCLMDVFFCRIQRHTNTVRLWTVQDQLMAVQIISIFFRSSPENINNTRCVTAFASLMLSPHVTVVSACDVTLSSLSHVPGFAIAIAIAYFNLLEAFPPQLSPDICRVVLMLESLKQICMRMVDHPRFDDLAMEVLVALRNPSFDVRKKVLNIAVRFLTPVNVGDVLRLLMSELDLATNAGIAIEYPQMLEEAIRECHSVYRESMMQFILNPKYLVFRDCIHYIKDIMNCNPLLRAELLKGLLRALRHVRSSPVCAAAVWAISVCSESLLETHHAMAAISPLFDNLLDRYNVEKLIHGDGGEEMEYETRDCYGVKEGDAQGGHLQPCLMEMEELLFVHIGLTRQSGGGYAIASNSKNSASSQGVPSLNHTDNLAFLVQSGDMLLLADFVENITVHACGGQRVLPVTLQ